MMAEEMLRTRCAAGWLIITERVIRIERKGLLGGIGAQQTVIPHALLVAASMQVTAPSVFGKGGAATITLTAQGMTAVIVQMVLLKDARRVMELLGFA